MANDKPNPQALAFGRRMLSCLAENEESLDDLHDLTKISKVRLVGFKLGLFTPRKREVEAIADALGVSLEKLWTPPSARKTQHSRSEGTKRRRKRRVTTPLFKAPSKIECPEKPMAEVSQNSEQKAPEEATPAPEPIPEMEEPTMADPVPPTPPCIQLEWDKSQTIAAYGDLVFDLGDRKLRSLIADRIRFAKGFMSAHDVLQKAKLKGWQPNRLTSLTDIRRKELEAIAAACEVSVLSLLSGEGISCLAPSESAILWLERYRNESDHSELVARGVDEMSTILASYHPALAHMIVLVLAERLRS